MAYILELIQQEVKNPQGFQAQKKIFAAYLEYLSALGPVLTEVYPVVKTILRSN
jgi:hypothetical protein